MSGLNRVLMVPPNICFDGPQLRALPGEGRGGASFTAFTGIKMSRST